MPLIRPISDLRNKAKEISELAHQADEAVVITRGFQASGARTAAE